MQKINFQDLPSTTTPLNASNMNAIQSNVEDVFDGDVPMGNIRVDSIKSKNMWNNNMFVHNSIDAITTTATGFNFTRGSETGGKYVYNTIPVESGKTYTMSLTGIATNISIIIYSDYVYGTAIASTTTGTLTFTPNYTGNVIASIILSSAVTSATITNIQFEKGSSATSYAPFQNLNVPHYDEGSFSPTIFGDTTAGTANYTLQEGKYVRIGKLVHIEIRLGCTLTGSSGFLLIGNLPFSSYWREPGIISVVSNLTTSSTPWLCRVYGRNLLIGTCNLDNISNKNWSSTGYIYLTGTLIMP